MAPSVAPHAVLHDGNEVTTQCMLETLSREILHAVSAVVLQTLVNRSFGQALNPVLGVGLKAQ